MHFGERMRLDARGLMRLAASAFCALLVIGVGTANAQDRGTLNPQPLPPLTKAPGPGTPAKELAARKTKPSPGPARSLGFYSHGCIAGAVPLPINGETWQVMRVSRNRYYGHPDLIAFIERFADKATKVGWDGLLIGDMSQPRGGPLPAGHISHQVGLDVDVWLTPMPKHELTRLEREEMMATMTVAADRKDVNPKVWTPAHFALIKAAAEDPRVTRILVNTAIKKALCREAGEDRAWLGKIQPWLGHDWHFHIRISCPVDSPDCESQPARPTEDGCHGGEMTRWGANPLLPDHSMPRAGPAMSALPKACFDVLKEP